jgi:hypothetical protein
MNSGKNGKNGNRQTSDQVENQHEPVAGLDGVLCPICGEVVKALPVIVHRVKDDAEERFYVCSSDCRQTALQSPFLQTNMFLRDLRVWKRSFQSELGIQTGPDETA